jgi:hypothetical protein
METMHPEAQAIAAYAGLRTLMGALVEKGVINYHDMANILNDAAHPLFHYADQSSNQTLRDAARFLVSDSLEIKARYCVQIS